MLLTYVLNLFKEISLNIFVIVVSFGVILVSCWCHFCDILRSWVLLGALGALLGALGGLCGALGAM